MRYQQSKYVDKTVTTLWSAVEVAELTGKTAQKVPPKDPERKPGTGGCGKGDRGGKGKPRKKTTQPCWQYKAGKCKNWDVKGKADTQLWWPDGGQTKPRKQRKAKVPTLVESFKTSLAKASTAPNGERRGTEQCWGQ